MINQEIIDYVMNTPHNTNPTILKQKIKEISGASSWNDLKDKPFGHELVGAKYRYSPTDEDYSQVEIPPFGLATRFINYVPDDDFNVITVQCTPTFPEGLHNANGVLAYLGNFYGCSTYKYNISAETDDGDYIEAYIGQLLLIPKDNENGLSPGIYYIQNTNSGYFHNAVFQFERIVRIDERYLPESVATKEYVNELLGVIENGTY